MPPAALTDVILPYSCVHDFLTSHPLVVQTKCNARRVYDGIVAMMASDLSRKRERDACAARAASSGTTTGRAPACQHCQNPESYLELDTKSAEMICTICGATARIVLENNCMPFEKADDGANTARRRSDSDGVPAWRHRSLHDDDELAVWRLRRDMEHMNAPECGGPNHDACLLGALAALAFGAIGRANAVERAVAALLFKGVREEIDLDDMRRRVAGGGALPRMPPVRPPQRVHSCPRCGAAVSTLSEARRHPCNWGKSSTRKKRARL